MPDPPDVSAAVPTTWGARARAWTARHRAPILLVALSVTFAELLTGSTPVFSLIDPIAILGLVGLYGSGVLLVREATLRWGKGWPTTFTLGAAYGILEEGIATRTFFNPHAVGFLGVYGHFLGVNWVWAVGLTLFHALFSIVLPIYFVSAIYPATRVAPFLTSRGVRWTVGILAATVLSLFLLIDPSHYRPDPALLAAALAAIALLVGLARVLPSHRSVSIERRSAPSRAALLGVAFSFAFFLALFLVPQLSPAPLVSISLQLALFAVVAGVLVRAFGGPSLARDRFAFAAGALGFLLMLAFVVGLGGDWGAIPVEGAVVALLVWAYQRRLPGRSETTFTASVPAWTGAGPTDRSARGGADQVG